MADEQYQWLDQEAAERLLRGESVDPVGTSARAEAELLARALDTARTTPAAGLTAGPGGELPGEAAALAAFREAVAERAATATVAAATSRRAGRTAATDLGAVRLAPVRTGRSWGRSLRYGLAAAVAAVTVGGVAVAAGTGVLPLTSDPGPGRSVVAADPSATGWSGSPTGSPGTPLPGGSGGLPGTPGSTDSPGATGTAGPDDPSTGPGRSIGGPDSGGDAEERDRTLKACQDFRAGTLSDSGRQRLTGALRNGETVKRYCDRVLSGAPSGATPTATGRTSSGSTGSTGSTGKGDTTTGGSGNGGSESGGSDGDDKTDRGDRNRDGGHQGGDAKRGRQSQSRTDGQSQGQSQGKAQNQSLKKSSSAR
ncbi:hypothetical protein [Streptomyces sp. NPDC048623]|uniref:hypothetical protein n=1 Tax=Streptomyces sp. NPDC048623 TaxID=3155761 RepID=UPI0034429627